MTTTRPPKPETSPTTPWTDPIVQALRASPDGALTLVRDARDAGLDSLARALLHADMDPDICRYNVLIRSSRSVLRIVPLCEDDLRSLERGFESLLGRKLRVVFWADAHLSKFIDSNCPRLSAALAAQVKCPDTVPDYAVEGLRACVDAPGVEWRGGPLVETLQAAFPGKRVIWASARMPWQDILAQCAQASTGWLCWTDIDGPFRLRQVRWALAEVGRAKRNVIVEPGEPSPGWTQVHGLVLPIDEATERLRLAGSLKPGLLAALTALEPEAIDIAEMCLKNGIREEDLLLALQNEGHGGTTLARIALDHGYTEINEVVGMSAPPPYLRAMAVNDGVLRMRKRCRDTIRRDLLGGECPDDQSIGVWATTSRSNLPFEILDHASGPLQGWLVEAILRSKPDDIESWRAAADAALRLGDATVAAWWADKAIAISTDDSLLQARALFTRARAFFRLGSFTEAEETARTCLDLREKALGAEHLDTAAALHVLGQALSRQGKHIKALAAYTRAHAIEKSTLGPEHPDTAITLHAIGLVMSNLNRFHEALDAFNQALAIKETTLGPEHPSTASTLHAIGQVHNKQGKYEEALEAFQKDLAITEKALGPEHVSAATTLHAMGQSFSFLGRMESALRCFQRELPIIEKAMGSQHAEVAVTLDSIGQALARLGRHAESAQNYHRAIRVKEKALGPEHLDVAFTYHAMAQAQAAAGSIQPAFEAYQKALLIREKTLGKDHQLCAVTLHAMAQILARRGRFQDAIQYFDRALAIKEQTLGPEHPETAITRFERGRALRDAGDPAGVAQMMGAASQLERILGKDHPNVAAAKKLLR